MTMTTNTIEPEVEATEPKFHTRAEAEAEIALLNDEIENLQELVKDDIERLEEQRDEIEDLLDDLPDEEEEKAASLIAKEWEKHDEEEPS
jgi:predicted  nucleic acid-binding Zn-ribbon protein